MDEKSHTPLPEGELPEDAAKSDPPIRPRRKQSVAIYLIILFAAAFLLLLMAYFMQQRNSNTIIGNLQDSLTSFQTMEEMLAENQQLRERLDQLEEDLESLQSTYDDLSQQYDDLSQSEAQAQAKADLRHNLYVAEYLYQAGDDLAAAQRLAAIPVEDLALLDDSSDSGAPTDAQRYETLKDALIASGSLTEDPDSGQIQVVLPES